ncbi:MAG TPA: tRNA (adenosine(37)-N6)-threonylcarbamoyltransferase complex dimerization subunit type 1 TsaB [Polyangia bacterium]|nr:tRNA (adenosine(37)-N6)-threonylcarbamoyltransferase complex dimerization subunit type 1 TsaB [Polyangia bacterium]
MISTPGPHTRVLCLDTSTPTARIAVVDGTGQPLAGADATADRHSGHVLKLCDDVLRGCGIEATALDAIACGAGPGSFTGLRVGLAVAKGLALATGKPILLASSLEALALDVARAAPEARVVVPCIDAGKGEVYALSYAVEGATVARGGEPWRLAPAALLERLADATDTVLAGNGAERHAAVFDTALPPGVRRLAVGGPTATSVGALVLPRLARGEADDLDGSVPFYGRPPDITTKRKT